jgi:DNA-binding CsgD family transcriptional regulator
VRKILELVPVNSDHAAEVADGNETLFEIEIDCVRYTLISSRRRPSCHLSSREKEIVRLVAEGLPNKCIGEILEISSWTVATHLRRIFAKMNVNSRTAMIVRLLEDRLLFDHR